MEKELLTKNHIKTDLKNYYTSTLYAYLILLLIFPFFIILGEMFSREYNSAIFILSFCLCFLAPFMYIMFYVVSGIMKANIGKFTIASDIVVKKYNKRISTNPLLNRPYTLIFSKYGQCGIPGTNYKWSKKFKENDKYIYKSTAIGDEFYIVRVDNKNIVAYNKNFFQLDE